MKILSYILPYAIALCYKTGMYVFIAGDYCSGTGRGSMRFFRLCNEIWLILPLIIDFLLVAGLANWARAGKPASMIRQVASGVCTIYIFMSPLVWELPFFLTPSR